MKLSRVGTEPVLRPRADVAWEKDAVLNCAALHYEGQFHLFYRGISNSPGALNRSAIGHAWSADGLRFERSDKPIVDRDTRPESTVGVEDPRIVLLDGIFHLTYVTWNEATANIALATSTDLQTWTDEGIIFRYEEFGNNKNATLWPEKLFGKYALIHRPMGFAWGREPNPLDMWLSLSDDLGAWTGHRRLLRARRGEVDWEYTKIGLGAPPIRTDAGWLMVYHAADSNYVYRLGLALLDLDDPTLVLKRTDEPILEPEAEWEVKGGTKNVVFTCGAMLLGSELWVYYGAADTVIGLARGDISDFISG